MKTLIYNGHSHERNHPGLGGGRSVGRRGDATTASPYTLTPIRAPWTSNPHGSMAAPSIQGHEETGAPLGKSVDDRPPAILSTLERGNSGRVPTQRASLCSMDLPTIQSYRTRRHDLAVRRFFASHSSALISSASYTHREDPSCPVGLVLILL